MSESRQTVLWTVLPNGIENGVIRLSVFVSPRLINPPDKEEQLLSVYPDFVDWIATLRRIAFTIAFVEGPTFEIPPRGDYEEYKDRRRRNLPRCVVPKPLDDVDNSWLEAFGTTPGSGLRPVVKNFYNPEASTRGIITYSTNNIKDVLENQLGAILPLPDPSPVRPDFRRTTLLKEFPTLADPEAREAVDLLGDISRRVNQIRLEQETVLQQSTTVQASTACPIRMSGEQRVSSLFNPPAGSPFTFAEWNVGLVLFTREALKNPSTNVSLLRDNEVEFHKKVASLSNYPYILRHLGLILDFELPFSSGRLPATGKVIVGPRWSGSGGNVLKTDYTPWTQFEVEGNRFQAAPSLCGSDLHHGLLDLSVTHNGGPCYSLEQRDGFTEAVNLYNYAVSLLADEENSTLPIYPAHTIALIHACSGDKLQERILTADSRNHFFESGKSKDVTLFADDLFRGWRMDIKVGSKWYSLTRRVGKYTFVQADETFVFEDEGWIASTIPKVKEGAVELLATHDTVCKWDGWSHSAPRPGTALESSDATKTEAQAATVKAVFTPQSGSLPRLRFGQSYKVRARIADLAGNGVNDAVNAEEDRVAQSITFLRYSPVPPPDFVPRSVPDTALGESEHTLVIRSNFDRRCEEHDERHVAPPRTSESMAEMHRMFDKSKDNSTRLDEDAYKTIVKYDGQPPCVYPDDEYEPPYLPDPLSVGAHFHNVPGNGDAPYLPINFKRKDKKWPRIKPWRIRIEEHPQETVPSTESSLRFFSPSPHEEDDEGYLQIYLPKAEVAKVTVSSKLLEDDLIRLMAYWELLSTSYPRNKEFFKNHILNGCHWMFTPCAQLTLVHAVQQPLFRPRFDRDDETCSLPDDQCVLVERKKGETSALLRMKMMMPGRSAIKFSVEGKWKEIIDKLPASCEEITMKGQAFEQILSERDELLSIDGRHEFNDTKHRIVHYTVVATTRFRQYLRLTDAEIANGAPITRESCQVRTNIPNSALPEAADVLYVIPTFGWARQQSVQDEIPTRRRLSRTRSGGGLRVYLKPPWYTTGENELLGVVLALPASARPLPDDPCVSQWGRDPLHRANGPTLLKLKDFDSKYYQRAEEVDSIECGGKIMVVGYPVKCDSNRGLWYCDIVMIPGDAYYPFVRLALSRYQPDSLADVKVSSTKIADFVQLAPERTASVVLNSSSPNQVIRIRLDGPAQVKTHRVEVVVERGIGELPHPTSRQIEIDDIEWEPVSSIPYQMNFKHGLTGDYWELDQVLVPLERFPHRILIRELETLEADAETGAAVSVDRVVYASTIDL